MARDFKIKKDMTSFQSFAAHMWPQPKVIDKPWVVEGKIEIRPVIKICATGDHRTIDGYKGAQLAAELREFLTNPEGSFGLSERIRVSYGI